MARPPANWWVVAIALLSIGAGSLTAGLRGHRVPLAGPEASARAPVLGPAPAGSNAGPRHVVARSAPVTLRIPAIGVSVAVGGLGLNPDGTVEVPTDFAEPGWFRLGPSPGQIGSAVILGHVDSYQGPAVFFRLRSLRVGDQIEVGLDDGTIVRFAVTAVTMYPKEEFPGALVYGSRDYSALQLVTCGGTFDTRTRSYLSNVVVFSSLVDVSPPVAG